MFDWITRRRLFKAIEKGNLAKVKSLVSRGADLAAEKAQRTPLPSAIERGHLSVVQFLLAEGAKMSRRDAERHRTALHLASHCGHVEIARLLLDSGADVNARIEDGNDKYSHRVTPIHEVVIARNYLIAEAIPYEVRCKTGDVEFASYATPQHVSREANLLAVMKLLVENGADIDASWSYSSNATTPLIHAIKNYDLAFVKYLVTLGANVNARVEVDGDTPLLTAVWNRNLPIVEFLVACGADVNARNTTYCHNDSALNVAAGLELMPILYFLVAHGADDIEEALADAVRGKKVDACRYLVDVKYGRTVSMILQGLEKISVNHARTIAHMVSPESMLANLCRNHIEQFPDSSLWEVTKLQDVSISIEIGGHFEGGTYWWSGISGEGGHVVGQTYVKGRDVVISLDRREMRDKARAELKRRLDSRNSE